VKPGGKLVALVVLVICAGVGGVLIVAGLLGGGAETRAIWTVEGLGGNVVRDPDAAGHPVVSVELGNTRVRDADLKVLRQFPELRELHLIGTDVTDAGLREIGELRGLQMLNLRRTRVTDSGLRELWRLANLRILDLADTEVSDAGLEELRGLASLRRLDVVNTRVTAGGVKELRRALPELEVRH
jgi:hypothetical protein